MKKTVQLLATTLLLFACNSKPSVEDAQLDKIAEKESQEALEKAQEEKVIENWSYEVSTDEMTDEVTSFAKCRSKNFVNLDFPYEGGTWLDLIVRQKGKTIDIYAVATIGQITTDYNNPTFKIRFDDEKPFYNGVSETTSNESNIRFINGASKLLDKIKTHSKMKIEVVFYDQGTFVFDFDISKFPNK